MKKSKQMINKLKPNDQTIKKFIRIIRNIYKSLNSPLPTEKDPNSGIKNYTDKNGNIHFSKMLRNSVASQRLFSMMDRIKEAIFTLQYFEGEFEFKNPKVNRKYLEIYLGRYLIFLNIQIVNGLINFLAHFFDLPTRDQKINKFEFLNFLYLKDKKICSKIEKILISTEFENINKIFLETCKDYCGLSKITDFFKIDEKSIIRIEAIKGYPITKVRNNTIQFINKFYIFLQFLEKHIKVQYKSNLGYDSSNDFACKVDPDKSFLKGSTLKNIEKAKISSPIKIFNLITDFPKRIETNIFFIEQNYTFKELKDKFYRLKPEERIIIKGQKGSPVIIKKDIYKPQEGEPIWTHTLVFKEKVDRKSKLIKVGRFSEDICLLLSLFAGMGVYTNETSLRYSHKARINTKIYPFEFEVGIKVALEKINNSKKEELNIMGMALSKYREAMQPMSWNNRLVRLWEVIDIIADFYCQNPKKDIPHGYNYNTLKRILKDELDKLENKINIPLRQGFTPILINKSIIQKIIELLELLEIYRILNVNSDQLNKRLKEAYYFRSKLTHSSKINFKGKNKNKLVNYYFFISELLFIILLTLLNFKPKQTLKEIKTNINGFVKDKNYYKNRSERIKKKIEEFNYFINYLTGKKQIPNGKISFIF